MFELLGDKPEAAAAEAKTVMQIETMLAKPALDRVAMRKPENRDHAMSPQQLAELAPAFEFTQYFAATGAPAITKVNVVPPDFFKQVNAQLDSVPLSDWKTYLRWHLVRVYAPWLSAPFVSENFGFFNHYLEGQQEQQARWKRCVRITDFRLGEALGQPYVDLTFGVEGKQRTLSMVQEIEKAMGKDLQMLSWMTPETKKAAAVKLAGISNKIGYPDTWRDYSKLDIIRGDFFTDLVRADNFERHRQLNKIGKPTDKLEWGMSPPTVNAYYNSTQNNINFPAGILQPPFFDPEADDAVNYGGIGAAIGHEMGYGFDDSGSQYDADGNLKNWWTDTDRAAFKARTNLLVKQFDAYEPLPGEHINGRLTLGENIGDLGGLEVAFTALQKALQKAGRPAPIDGFSPEQRFFWSWAQIWRGTIRDEALRVQLNTNPHSPGKFRVLGPLSDMPEFYQAFGCGEGDKMVRPADVRVIIW
jgi:putative endopeptidase